MLNFIQICELIRILTDVQQRRSSDLYTVDILENHVVINHMPKKDLPGQEMHNHMSCLG